MKLFCLTVARYFFIVAGVLWLGLGNILAGTSGGIYNMSGFLNQQHPFNQVQASPRPSLGGRIIGPSVNPKLGVPSQSNNPYIRKAFGSSQKPMVSSTTKPSNNDNIVSEIRIGGLIHDEGPFSHRKEKGYDGNVEVLFISPSILEKIWSPRPHIGMSKNNEGDTNQAYLGLTWEWKYFTNFFTNFSFGGAYHDGYKFTTLTDRKTLGCKVLFRESLDLGYRFGGIHSIMAHLDHISNAKLCSNNEGLESVGIRYGYHF